jgi:acid phosphatase type 7
MSNMVERALLVGFGILAAACSTNQSGNTGATKTGDTSRSIDRRSPTDELRDACGDGGMTADGAAVMRRQPYLQQVTTTGAKLGWVTTDTDGALVKVTTPDGTEVQTSRGELEAYAMRAAGENQVWSDLNNLTAGTTYCYEVQDAKRTLDARTGFRTAPASENTDTIRFLAFGDSGGGGTDQYHLMEQMKTVPFDLMIHTGDLAYDDGTITQFEDNVFGVYEELFRNIPFFPAAGNHEYNTLQGAPFRDVFNLPGQSGEKWYSYDWGRVHFAALDTEADYATQAAWLDKDLAASTSPWKIVYMHRPPYSSGEHGSDTKLRDILAPVFEKHHVQLVLAGHDHHYERAKAVNGVNYVVTGGGGRGTRPVSGAAFTDFAVSVIHFVVVEVGTDELVLHAIDATGKEFDSLAVPR